jgi:poly-gamma-glutamate synthesis protein (capsule biosynthesis protein)
MMHARQLQYDHSHFLDDLAPLLSGVDMAIANAEFTLAGPPYTGYPAFSAPDGYLKSITDAGVDVLLTANNHILDKGSDGLVRTLKQYDVFTGSGLDEEQYNRNNPLIISRNGIRVALVNFTYGTNAGASREYPKVSRMDREEISRQMRRARKNADFVIVLPHWGEEYVLKHNASQEKWAEWLAGEGADAIIGAHPHVVQDTAIIKGVPVVYSMGNAVSNMSAINTRLGLAVTLTLVKDRFSGCRELKGPELHFLWCTLPGRKTGSFRTVLVEEQTGRRDDWIDKSDYDNMTATLERVKKETGIK